jgi:sugar phosphate isomerase/epimerase
MNPKIGLQLYTIRDELAKDFKGAIRKVAAMGYAGVGYGATGDLTPSGFGTFLAGLGMTPVSGSLALDALESNAAGALQPHQDIGAPYAGLMFLPEGRRKTVQDWKSLAPKLTEWGRMAKDRGLVFQYHNHDFEFQPVGGTTGLAILAEATDPEAVHFQLDVGWVKYAGHDPVEWMRRLGPRIRTLHLKDVTPEKQWTELGRGHLGLREVWGAAIALGIDWVLVEQDTTAGPPLESAATSLHNLKRVTPA